MAITGIDHLQLAAPPGSESEARRFFGKLLGLPELQKPEALRSRGGAWFAAGDQQLHIGIETGFSPAKKAHPALVVDDFDTTVQRLGEAGYPLRADDSIQGVRRGYITDPWGNRLELIAEDRL
jgi:catechol 2,3-dioxygenase-like lactoylglutathione lyase family enzyme